MSALATQLSAIESALDSGTYSPGAWERFLAAAAHAPPEERRAVAGQVDRVSDKLHARKGDVARMPAERGVALEVLGMMAGLVLLALGAVWGSGGLLVVATLVLGTTLQPLLKVSTGIALGMGYSYAYLWRGEPRFKLRYGRFLAAERWLRVLLHASGTLGTPLGTALGAAVAAAAGRSSLASVLGVLLVAHLLFQAALFALALRGVRRVPVLGLLRLTSAGAAAFELRAHAAPVAPAPPPSPSPVESGPGRTS